MIKFNKDVVVEEAVVDVDKELVQDAKEIIAEARKAKIKSNLAKAKKIAIESAKYVVPAVVTGVLVRSKYANKTEEIETVDGEFEVIEDDEIVEELDFHEEESGE